MSTTAAMLAVLAISAAGGLLAWRITADTDTRDAERRRAERRRILDEIARHHDDRRR